MDGMTLYEALHAKPQGEWGTRILAEMGFLLEMSRVSGGKWMDRITEQLALLQTADWANGAITRADVQRAEAALSDLAPEARAYEITCAAHAHIDMNWMWGFQETAVVTIDTFRTMLKLMDEYPDFTFSQSQASVYRIVAEYAPELLDPIRARVHEGRWEVTASTWVENDKNMSGSEAMARHLLYTKRYLSKLLDIPAESIQLDFEPDTFGHCANLPEILNNGGIRYYYHCRGMNEAHIYNWQAPSGAQVLVYREPAWYNQTIEPDMFRNVPSFCAEYHTKQYLKVYGVGDHGGGPTRRDVSRLVEMAGWPLFPTIRFGTIHGFFRKLERDRAAFPTVCRELNYVFTGCYTSQSRIKQANQIGEDRLYESEALDSMAGLMIPSYRTTDSYETAWRRILFNQFHDILPGSGVPETRAYALGEFQKAVAAAQINGKYAMEQLCAAMNTSAVQPDGDADRAAGAGVGYGTSAASGFGFPSAERGAGAVRLYTLFNPSQFDRDTAAELTVWDWPGDPERMVAETADGRPIPVQLLESGQHYWDHHFHRLLLKTAVPSFGYTTVVLRSAPLRRLPPVWHPGPDCDFISDQPIELENEYLHAVFSPNTMALCSLVDRETGAELLHSKPAGVFRLITEETGNGMTAWRVGKYAKTENLSEMCPVTVSETVHGALRQQIRFELHRDALTLRGTVMLDAGSRALRYHLTVDWRLFGDKQGIPQLQFAVPLAASAGTALCATPYGVVERPALAHDVPCLGAMAAPAVGDRAVMLLSDCKYGFRNNGDELLVNLIRASYDPDPMPEIGEHTIDIGIGVDSYDPAALLRMRDQFVHPTASCANTAHSGSLAPDGQAFAVQNAVLTAVKRAENGSGWIFRMYNADPIAAEALLRFPRPVSVAERTDVLENGTEAPLSVNDCTVRVVLSVGQMATVRVLLAPEKAD